MAASEAFYAALGLSRGPGSFNQGPAQQRLDDLPDVAVAVTPMIPEHDPPHVELLGYRAPRAGAGPKLAANDVAGTRIVWQGSVAALVRDPDGHFHQIES